MSGHTVLELGTALLCGFLAALHFVFWRVRREDRLQLWLAFALVGLTFLNLSIAGSSVAARGALGPAARWLLLSFPGPIFGWAGGVLAIFALAGRPVTGVRRLIVAVVFAGGLITGAYEGWYAVRCLLDPELNATWEYVAQTNPFRILPNVIAPSIGIIGLAEVVIEVATRRRILWVLLGPMPVVFALAALEAMRTDHTSPTLVGVIGAPVMLIASCIVIARYTRAVESEQNAGGYRLVRRIAGGGMGELFLAVRTGAGGFEHPVALKRVLEKKGSDPAAIDRLLTEARLAAALVHPNVIAVHDVGRLPDTFGWFIAMEYLPGVDLSDVRDAAQRRGILLPAGFVVRVAEEVARGLAYAHGAGVVHHDVSPHNVMVTFEGAVKLVDFGIAAAAGDAQANTDYVVGKISYLSPERIRGGASAPASDLFALGVVIYELLTGVKPFRGRSPVEITDKVLKGEYPALRSLRPEIPDEVVALVDRALQRDATARFASAGVMADALRACARKLDDVELGAFVRELCGAHVREHEQAAAALEEATGTTVNLPATAPAAQLRADGPL